VLTRCVPCACVLGCADVSVAVVGTFAMPTHHASGLVAMSILLTVLASGSTGCVEKSTNERLDCACDASVESFERCIAAPQALWWQK